MKNKIKNNNLVQHLFLKLLLHVHTAYCFFIYLCLCITHKNGIHCVSKKNLADAHQCSNPCYMYPPIILFMAQEIKIHCWRAAKSDFQNNNTTLCHHLLLPILIITCLLVTSFESGINLVTSCNNFFFYVKVLQIQETRTLISGLIYTSPHHVFCSLIFTKKHVLCVSSVYPWDNQRTNQS